MSRVAVLGIVARSTVARSTVALAAVLSAVVLSAVVSAVVLSVGCAAHVQLDPPPLPSAAHQSRSDYYEAHKPAKAERGELVMRARLGDRSPTVTQRSFHLENGARVQLVEDLTPLIAPGSATAAAIAASLEARGRADVIMGIGYGVGIAGIATGAGLVGSYVTATTAQTSTDTPPVVIAGITAAVVGGLGGAGLLTWGMTIRDDEDDARTQAWRSFDADLRTRLQLDEPVPAPLSPQPPE